MMGCGMRSSMLSLSLPSSSARTQPLHAALVAAETWIAASGAHNTFAVVPNRSLIEIRGVDSVKYLQGMITNQMTKVERGGEGMLAAWLNAQGRVLFDTFIYPKNLSRGDFPHPTFLVECDSRAVGAMLSHVKKYALRSKLSVQDVSHEMRVIQAWGPSATNLWGNYIESATASKLPAGSIVPKESFINIGCKDPRSPLLGVRAVLPIDHDRVKFPLSEFSEVSSDEYTLRRILLGVPEGISDLAIGQSLPLESNFDLMSGIDFRKGCYLGQELTIRTYHTGVTRKRIVPVQLYDANTPILSDELMVDETISSGTQPPAGSEIRIDGIHGRKGEIGRLGCTLNNVGLALLRLEYCHSPLNLDIPKLITGDKQIRAFPPRDRQSLH